MITSPQINLKDVAIHTEISVEHDTGREMILLLKALNNSKIIGVLVFVKKSRRGHIVQLKLQQTTVPKPSRESNPEPPHSEH